jgi:hypothetical protein
MVRQRLPSVVRSSKIFALAARFVASLIAAMLVPTIACAQSESLPDAPPTLPSDPQQWINTGPLSYENFRGKGVVLWYFEETCPRCARKWPGMLKMSQDMADQPVLFLAVNSGKDRKVVQSYVRKHKIDWPVLVDPDRSFEAASGVPQISLQKIHTMRLVTSDGGFTYGYWNDWKKSLDIALRDATWKVNYDRLHPSMHGAVRRLEFGIFRPVAVAIKTGLKDESPDVRRAAEFTKGYVDRQMQEELRQTIVGKDGKDPWVQYQALELVSERFAPLELPEKASAKFRQLRADPKIQKESRASKAVEANAKMLQSPDAEMHERAVANLEQMQTTYAGTHAATRAAKLLADLPAQRPEQSPR